jgi:hypothetical protein
LIQMRIWKVQDIKNIKENKVLMQNEKGRSNSRMQWIQMRIGIVRSGQDTKECGNNERKNAVLVRHVVTRSNLSWLEHELREVWFRHVIAKRIEWELRIVQRNMD